MDIPGVDGDDDVWKDENDETKCLLYVFLRLDSMRRSSDLRLESLPERTHKSDFSCVTIRFFLFVLCLRFTLDLIVLIYGAKKYWTLAQEHLEIILF